MVKIIVFLGNPGAEYRDTRHNIAWQMADRLSFAGGLDWQAKFKGVYASYPIGRIKYIFLKPTTFMNRAGESVRALCQFFKIDAQEVLVVHDDLELEFGRFFVKKGGGLGGHNGLRSVASALGSRDFYRFRLGISRPAHDNVSGYVLGKFTPSERLDLDYFLDSAAKALEECLYMDIDEAVRRFG